MDRIRNSSIRGTRTSWTKDGAADDHRRRLVDVEREDLQRVGETMMAAKPFRAV